MAGELEYFKQFLYEAPGDDPPPDISQQDDSGGDVMPPDLPEDNSIDMGADGPPDLPDDSGTPPDMEDDSGFGGDEFGGEEQQEDQNEKMELDEKISAIMNRNLYQRFLELLGSVTSQISQIKDNRDVLNSIVEDIQGFLSRLTDLEENIRLYLKNYFIHEDYGKNRLFFNKCLNLVSLLNMIFDDAIKKGIKHVDV